MSDLAPGVTFSNRYRLESCLGTGGTAAVWAARDLDLGRAVAVKVLLGAGVDPELARRFEHEGMILGRLSHPNLVSVFATGEHEGRPYLVMQLVEGEPLNEVLRDGPLPTEDAVRLVADVAAGLAAAHRAGVVHRDVKPANIICRPDGSPVVVDFGIARVDDLTGVTRPNVVVGTANYLAPEQARGEQPGPPTDVYALGCVLQETLTGRPPLTADTPVAVAYRHVHDDPDPLPSDVPAGIAAIVARCLAKEPTARYPTAAELEADLRVRFATPANATAVLPPVTVATGGEVIDPSPLVEPEPGGHRWPLIAAIVAAVVLLALVLGNGFGGDGGSDTPPADARASTTTTIATTTTAAPPTTAAAPAPAPREGRGKGKHGKD